MSQIRYPLQAIRMVAVCDVLGFKNLVLGKPLEYVAGHAVGWLRKALNHSVLGGEFPRETPPTSELAGNTQIGSALFSDTILLYTIEDSDRAVSALVQTVASLLFETIVEGQTKVRAGIAYGDVHIDPENSIYIGRPIVDAHQLEQCQEWAGAALNHEAAARVRDSGRDGEIARWWTAPWNVPLKSGYSAELLAVNWNHCVHDVNWRLRWSETSDSPPEDAPASLSAKFLNTRQFHEAHCADCRRE